MKVMMIRKDDAGTGKSNMPSDVMLKTMSEYNKLIIIAPCALFMFRGAL